MRRDVNNKTNQPSNGPQGGDLTRRLAKDKDKELEKLKTTTGSGIPAESPSASRSGEANSANRLQELLTSFGGHFGATMGANMGDETPVYRAEYQSNSQSSSLGRETLVKRDKICSDLYDDIRRFQIVYQKMTGSAFLRLQSDSPLKLQNIEKPPEKFVGDQPRETDGIPERTGASEDIPITEFFRRYIEYKEQKAREGQANNTSDQPREADEAPERTGASEVIPITEFFKSYIEYKKQQAREGQTNNTSDQPGEAKKIPKQTGASKDIHMTEFLKFCREYKKQQAREGQADRNSKEKNGDGEKKRQD